jgi:hypothetical protein
MRVEVFVLLGDAGEQEPKLWIFDTGPSNHMTDIRELFAYLDTSVIGMVQYGDGSVVWIKGCGTILFTCKSKEHQTRANTYYILGLTANIVSCGQLDEDSFPIHIERGIMRIHDEKMWLLAKIRCCVGWLYVLNITIARPVYLGSCRGQDAWRWHSWLCHINFESLQKMG